MLGIDPWTALLDTSLGRPANLAPTRHGYATVRFLSSPRSGRLASVTELPPVGPGVPFVRLRRSVGARVDRAPVNSHRLGSFVVTGPDAQAVNERADALSQQIRVAVEPHTDANPLQAPVSSDRAVPLPKTHPPWW
ncbi:hypothetical protein ACWD4L_27140 [Streptomyces sp. NPDC002596]